DRGEGGGRAQRAAADGKRGEGGGAAAQERSAGERAHGQSSASSSKSMRAPSTCARPIVCAGARRRSVGEPGLKIWNPSSSPCSGRWVWPKTTAAQRGNAARSS